MSVGISTACFYPAATEEALRCVAEAGAKVTEVFFNSPSELEPDFLRRISSIASDSGIRIRSIHPFTSFAEGYILFSQYERRFDDYREFYKKYYAAALFLRVVGGSLVNRSMDIKSAIFQLFLQGTSAGGYWFLYTLFVISVIAPLFWVILKKNRLLGLPIIAVCVIVSALFDLPEICCLKSVVYYLTYFIIGMMLKGCDFGKIKDKRIVILTVSAAVFCLSFIPLRIYADKVYSVAGIYISALSASAFFASFFSLVKMPKFIKNQLMTSGKYSLQYYLLNAFLVTGLRWLVVTKVHITTPALIVLILFAGSYIVSYLVSKYILDSNNFFRFLCGLKVQKNK